MLSSSSRLLRVLSLLQTRSHWAGPELAQRLDVHPRTLRRDQLQVGFHYRDLRGQASVRTVEPHALVHTGNHWYLVAWDSARDDWRTFRIDRVEGAPRTGEHFAPRPAPAGDLRAYVSGALAGMHQGEQARVVLHRPREVMARTIPPSAATLETIDDARCLMLCGAGQLDSLVYWLMVLEVDFDVLEPPVLKERLRVASERVARSLARAEGDNAD